jgi:rhamnogalacturonan endolyase
MWADAQRRAAAEVARWPQPWMTAGGFHERGEVRGRLVMADGTPPEGAWALLALPGGDIPGRIEFGHWWRDVGSYHYAAAVGPDGTFAIPHVRAGDYSLFLWKPGVFGEFRRDGLRVAAGGAVDAGTCLLEARARGRLLWQVGEADRGVTEFRNGGNFHQWDTYLRYRDDFPEDVRFVVGRSDPARDWNYLQPAVVPGEAEPTTWTIAFDFEPALAGEPVVTIVAGGRGADLDVLLNGAKIGELHIGEIGLQHIRTVPNGELTVHEYRFDRALIRPGRNTLALTFARPGGRTEEGAQWVYQNWTNYIAYDFIRLEMSPP